MKSTPTDQEILDILIEKLGFPPQKKQFDAHGNLVHLSFYGYDLTDFPSEIFQFTHLEHLDLSCNQLPSLSSDIKHLINLKTLHLNHNRLAHLPAEIGCLKKLKRLVLSHNCLTALPPEIGLLSELRWFEVGNRGISFMPEDIQNRTDWEKYTVNENHLTQLPHTLWDLKNLQWLDLWANALAVLPPQIGQLTNLTTLMIGRNRFTSLPPTIGQLKQLRRLTLHGHPLTEVPSELGNLTQLEYLSLEFSDHIMTIPDELWQLSNLKDLHLRLGAITALPPGIRNLTHLETLFLQGNHLTSLPSELWQLTQLQNLHIFDTQLEQIPTHIGLLSNLCTLDWKHNQLTHLPCEIGQLSQLEVLNLQWNDLRQLPPEIGNLKGLKELRVTGNSHLLTPPPEIVQRGLQDILAFLTELQRSSITRYEAKLLVVGEGGTGKSSLLRTLQGKHFVPLSETTHGIAIHQLELPMSGASQKLTLNTWDFGGQHIYHATHQFFLTQRSIYLIVWNARLGVEQGRIPYWLETIKALAPDAPVLLVSTHIDERTPDMNYQQLKNTYPQIMGQVAISNKTGEGIDDLKEILGYHASQLPLIGQPWPETWLTVEHILQAHPEHHIPAATYADYCRESHIEESVAQGTLADYLHDLGKILYFHDDPILNHLIILKPNWITYAISLVLTDTEVRKAHGILQHAHLARIWSSDETGRPYSRALYPLFLRLMERFDLSYQIEDDVPGTFSSSLIPQLLPYQPPITLPEWPKLPPPGDTQLEMVYRFNFLPAGIMSWFIVRTHRYTQHVHWREGVLLTYQGHQARAEIDLMRRELRLVVWGLQPHNFFTILMNTIDIILSRFQGLTVRQEIPCICHWQQSPQRPCPHFYSYEELVRRMEAKRHTIECAQTFTDVSVPRLLYGIHMSTDTQVLTDIQQSQRKIEKRLDDLQKLDNILEKLQQQSELIVRNFTRHWNLEMQKMNAPCPNTFLLTLGQHTPFQPKNWISQEYKLYLICQHPSGPHIVGDGYLLREAKEWWARMSPWLNHLIKFLKFGIPMGKAIGAVYDEVAIEHMQTQIALMEEIVKHVPETTAADTLKDAVMEPHLHQEWQIIGPALRALHSFLIKADPDCTWGGLQQTMTPDGNILWLCETHHKLYQTKPLAI